MNTDDFEQLLRRQPLRTVPPEWREEILTTARAGTAGSAPAGQPSPQPLRGSPLIARLRDWLWPNPVAWAVVAASWVVVAVLNSAAGGPVVTAMRPLPTSANAWAARVATWEESSVGIPSEPLAPPPRRMPNAPVRRPGTTWIAAYEKDIA